MIIIITVDEEKKKKPDSVTKDIAWNHFEKHGSRLMRTKKVGAPQQQHVNFQHNFSHYSSDRKCQRPRDLGYFMGMW